MTPMKNAEREALIARLEAMLGSEWMLEAWAAILEGAIVALRAKASTGGTEILEMLAIKNQWEDELLNVCHVLGVDPPLGYKGVADLVRDRLSDR